MSTAGGRVEQDDVEVVPGWRRRRRLRQRLTLAVVVLAVLGAGLAAAGLYTGYLAAGDDQPLPTCAPAPRRPAALAPRQVTVDVYNGSGRSGLAGTTAAALQRHRFVVGKVANAPRGVRVTSAAIVRYGPRGKPRATLLATYVPGARLIQDSRTSTLVDLVLGRGFTAIRTKPVAAPKPVARPPAKPTPRPTATTTATPTATCAPAPARPSPTGGLRSRPTTTPR